MLNLSLLNQNKRDESAIKFLELQSFDRVGAGLWSDGSDADALLIPANLTTDKQTLFDNFESGNIGSAFIEETDYSYTASTGEKTFNAPAWAGNYKKIKTAIINSSTTFNELIDSEQEIRPFRAIEIDSTHVAILALRENTASSDDNLCLYYVEIDSDGNFVSSDRQDVYSTNQYNPNIWDVDMTLVNTDKILIAYCTNNTRARVADVSGGSISLGTEFTLDASSPNGTSVCKLDNDKALAFFGTGNQEIAVLSISGTTITKGANVALTDNDYVKLVQLDTDKALTYYADNNTIKASVITVSSTTPTEATPQTIMSTSRNLPNGSVLKTDIRQIATDKVLVSDMTNASGSDANVFVLSVSSTTITSHQSTGALLRANNISNDAEFALTFIVENTSGSDYTVHIGHSETHEVGRVSISGNNVTKESLYTGITQVLPETTGGYRFAVCEVGNFNFIVNSRKESTNSGHLMKATIAHKQSTYTIDNDDTQVGSAQTVDTPLALVPFSINEAPNGGEVYLKITNTKASVDEHRIISLITELV